jgi:hypothetical protein
LFSKNILGFAGWQLDLLSGRAQFLLQYGFEKENEKRLIHKFLPARLF